MSTSAPPPGYRAPAMGSGREGAATDPGRTSSPSPSPFFTVLIVAYRRTEYLRSAIDSVLGQTLGRERYEVVLTMGVHDPGVEQYCRERGVTLLFEESWDLGHRINRALEACSGQVIVLLEDDDEFAPTKLAVLWDEFHGHPDLAYYHNGFETIGPHGEPLDQGRFRRRSSVLSEARGPVYSPPGNAWDRFVRLAPLDPSWNTSSLAFRRELLEGHRGELDRLAFMADRLVYFCALTQNRSILLDSRRLTRYRLHAANASGHGGRARRDRAGVDELVGRIHSIADRQLADLERLAALLQTSPEPRLAGTIQEGLPLLRLYAALRDPKTDRTTILRRLGGVLRRQGLFTGDTPWAGSGVSTVALYLLTLLYLFNPRWGPPAYVRLRELSRPSAS
jgi:hypothetical protein